MVESVKSRTISLRLGEEEEHIINEMQSKFNINSKSELLRLAIHNMNHEGNMAVLPKLCGVCSMVNNILENVDTDVATKINLRKELNEIWMQLS